MPKGQHLLTRRGFVTAGGSKAVGSEDGGPIAARIDARRRGGSKAKDDEDIAGRQDNTEEETRNAEEAEEEQEEEDKPRQAHTEEETRNEEEEEEEQETEEEQDPTEEAGQSGMMMGRYVRPKLVMLTPLCMS